MDLVVETFDPDLALQTHNLMPPQCKLQKASLPSWPCNPRAGIGLGQSNCSKSIFWMNRLLFSFLTVIQMFSFQLRKFLVSSCLSLAKFCRLHLSSTSTLTNVAGWQALLHPSEPSSPGSLYYLPVAPKHREGPPFWGLPFSVPSVLKVFPPDIFSPSVSIQVFPSSHWLFLLKLSPSLQRPCSHPVISLVALLPSKTILFTYLSVHWLCSHEKGRFITVGTVLIVTFLVYGLAPGIW